MIDVKLTAFEGPLDVLYHLIQKNKIDIYDIPIALLADQYIEFIKELETDKMDSMSSFVVMGATLLEIKSRLLLPGNQLDEENPEDLKSALILKLVEYKKFKEISAKMIERAGFDDLMYFKPPDKDFLSAIRDAEKNNRGQASDYLVDISLKFLYNTYTELLRRKKASVNEATHVDFEKVSKEIFTVNDKIDMIIDMLGNKKGASFGELFGKNAVKEEKIVTFLAVLELIKMKMVNIRQDIIFGDIELALIPRFKGGSRHQSDEML